MSRVGQNHIYIYGVYTVVLAGKSPNIRSYTVYIYGPGQLYTNSTSQVYWYIASSKLTRYCQMYRNLSTSHVYCVLTFVSYKHVTPFGCLCSLSSARTDSVLTHFLPRVNILGLTFNACMILLTHPAPCLMNG